MLNLEFENLIHKRINNRYNYFDLEIIKESSAIIFLYAVWSPSIVQLRNLITSLNDFPQIFLYIFNVDDSKFEDFMKKNRIKSNGWGETFWIKSGKVIAELDKYNSRNLSELLNNNNSLRLSQV